MYLMESYYCDWGFFLKKGTSWLRGESVVWHCEFAKNTVGIFFSSKDSMKTLPITPHRAFLKPSFCWITSAHFSLIILSHSLLSPCQKHCRSLCSQRTLLILFLRIFDYFVALFASSYFISLYYWKYIPAGNCKYNQFV